MHPLPAVTIAGLLLVCLATMGCVRGDSGRPQTAPVSGRITFRGQPVANAAVTFVCSGAPRFSSGRTDADGKFKLSTFEPGDGAVIGDNLVTVVKRATQIDAINASIDPASGDNRAIDDAFDQAASRPQARSEIPVRYASQKNSDLRFTVIAGKNHFDIELVD